MADTGVVTNEDVVKVVRRFVSDTLADSTVVSSMGWDRDKFLDALRSRFGRRIKVVPNDQQLAAFRDVMHDQSGDYGPRVLALMFWDVLELFGVKDPDACQKRDRVNLPFLGPEICNRLREMGMAAGYVFADPAPVILSPWPPPTTRPL